MKRAIITGGSGFIGTHLCRALENRMHLQVIDLCPPASDVRVEYSHCDVADAFALSNVWSDADYVFHLAAEVSVPECEGNPGRSLAVNLNGTQHVCDEILKRSPKAKLVFASSSAIYGDTSELGFVSLKESVQPAPMSCYALHKLWSEQLIRHYCATRSLRAVCLRFFNVYGLGQDLASPYSGVISKFISAGISGSKLRLFNGGQNTRDFVHVKDVVRALIQAAETDLPTQLNGHAFNIGSGSRLSVEQVAKTVSQILDTRGVRCAGWEAHPARPGDVPHSLADISSATTQLNWQPSAQFSVQMEELISDLLAERDLQ